MLESAIGPGSCSARILEEGFGARDLSGGLSGSQERSLLGACSPRRSWRGRRRRRRRRRGATHHRCDVRRRSGGRVLLILLDLPQLGDVAQVLVIIFGNDVPATSVRDKLHLLGARRLGRRLIART